MTYYIVAYHTILSTPGGVGPADILYTYRYRQRENERENASWARLEVRRTSIYQEEQVGVCLSTCLLSFDLHLPPPPLLPVPLAPPPHLLHTALYI